MILWLLFDIKKKEKIHKHDNKNRICEKDYSIIIIIILS